MAERRSVLLAEDDPTLLKLVTRLLAGAGYEVIPAVDSTAALETLGARRAGLAAAVLDAAILPAGAQAIVESIVAGGDAIGFVLVSGDALEGELAELARQHGGVFLHKPFAPRELLEAVETSRTVD